MNIALVILIATALAGAILSAIVAHAKYRSPVGWGIAGAAFPLLGLIAIAGMPMGNPKPQVETQTQAETQAESEVPTSSHLLSTVAGVLAVSGTVALIIIITLNIR